MAIPDSYLVTTRNLKPIIDAIQKAQAPDKFTTKFLEQLGFTSSNDRLYVSLFKSLGLLDNNGTPTSLYYDFLDKERSQAILANCIKGAYEDLYQIDTKAHTLSKEQIINKFKTLTEGSKKEHIYSLMANTFLALAEYADFNSATINTTVNQETQNQSLNKENEDEEQPVTKESSALNFQGGLHYNIQIHLPESKSVEVYEAIFSALKKHFDE